MNKVVFALIISFLSLFTIKSINASTTYTQGVVISGASIYKSAEASSSNRLVSDTGGVIVLYSPEAVEVIGTSDNFYQIKFLYSGFIYTGYIEKSKINVASYTVDPEYQSSLIALGFPSDYASKLAALHAIHPNWLFYPSFTGGSTAGMDFSYAVSGEAEVVSTNAINSSNTSLRSTRDGAYRNGEWLYVAGNGWYAASEQTIAFYMDPRNFLDESHIFMFENLGYNENTQTPDVINKILAPTFMKNPFTCIDGVYLCVAGTHAFTDTFLETGKSKSVSPVHLATRVIQEQGSGGSVLSLGLGYNGEYKGYYNFFNIGASGATDAEVIVNGFKYAVARKWNNQYASIFEGSSLIASNYITRGQSTRYYQKFNTIVKSYFSNQYMQNVRAPYSEAYQTYQAYYNSFASQDEWNNATYDFLIPIYSNMGGATTLDTSGNADATLKALNIDACKLSPSFQSSAYSYSCYVKKEITSLKVSADATNPLAKVEYEETVNLDVDDKTINILVTAANGNTATYTVDIHKIETDGYSPMEVLNGIGIKVTDSFVSNIDVGSDVSNIVNSIQNKYHFATVKITDSNGVDYNEGIIKTGVKISINNAGVTSNYTAIVYGDSSGDGLIDIRDLLIIQKHLVSAKQVNGEYFRASDINKDGAIDIRDLLLEQKYLLGQYSISQG